MRAYQYRQTDRQTGKQIGMHVYLRAAEAGRQK